MAAEVDDIVTYIFTGEEETYEWGDYIIPRNVTHLLFHDSITVIPARLFICHPNIVEVYCHIGVKIIEHWAFYLCPRLRRIIIPGVEVVVAQAFYGCKAVTDIECPKLERIEAGAFGSCKSLITINLPSAKTVQGGAFEKCETMTDVKFGKDLESIGVRAFHDCPALERITIPLKSGLFLADDIFQECGDFVCVDIVEGAVLRETIDALLLEEWRNDMNEAVDSIYQILPDADMGDIYEGRDGEKAEVIRDWIERVLIKIIDYKEQHRHLLSEASALLQLTALPNDIVMNNVLPFLEMPSYAFEEEGG